MSKINGLHEFNFGVIFLILTYFVRQWLLQKYNTCQPPPPVSSYPQVLHRLSKVVDNSSLPVDNFRVCGQPVDNFGGNIGTEIAWVDKCVDLCWSP